MASETITRRGDAVATRPPKRPGSVGARAHLRRLAAVVAPFVAWEIMARIADSRLLPTPLRVVERLWEEIASGTIWFHAKVTLLNGAIGLGIAIVVGISFGVLLARSRYAEAVWRDSGAADAHVLDDRAVADVFAEHRAGRADRSQMLYALAMFALWWSGRPRTS